MSRGRVAYVLMSAAIASLVGLVVSNFATVSAPRRYSVSSVTFTVVDPEDQTSSYYSGTLGVLNGTVMVGDDTSEFIARANGRYADIDLCRLAALQSEPLRLVSNRSIACDDPALAGQQVVPVESVEKGGNTGDVRISVLTGSDSVQVGPVVMRYGNYSDTRPEWTYGGGYLWIFDADALSRAEVLRISESTGAVLSKAYLPWSARVLLAADDDGLWIGQSPEGGWQKGEQLPLLEFVGNDASKPMVVSRSPDPQKGGRVDWLVASGHTAIAAVALPNSSASSSIEMFQSPSRSPRIVKTASSWEPASIGEGPADSPSVVEAPGTGLVATDPGWDGNFAETPSSETVVRIDPRTGEDEHLATIRDLQAENLWAYQFYDNALYLLGHANSSPTATLYRVQL